MSDAPNPAGGPMLVLQGVSKRFGKLEVLRGIDLEIQQGEVVCVLGPSGSGKTSLLRAIAGLEPPAAGRVVRDGVDVTRVAPHRRELGLMFQDHALFPHRDVLDNVAFGLRMHRVPRTQARARARETLALVGLRGFEHRRIDQLSGGEQQRVALARALAPEPRLLMLDEPLGALDRALRERLVEELAELFDRLELSVLLVTHDHDEAFALGHRVAVMDAGRIAQIDDPEVLWRHPASASIAGFLGWSLIPQPDGGAEDPVTLALRPDALRLRAPNATGAADVTGIVETRTFRRGAFRLRVQVDGGTALPPGSMVEVTITETPIPEPGQPVQLALDPDGLVALACTESPHLRQDSSTDDP